MSSQTLDEDDLNGGGGMRDHSFAAGWSRPISGGGGAIIGGLFFNIGRFSGGRLPQDAART